MEEEAKVTASAPTPGRPAVPPPSARSSRPSGTYKRVSMGDAGLRRSSQRRLPHKKPVRPRGKKQEDPHCCGVQWSIRAKQISWWVLSQCILIAMVTTALVLLEKALDKVYIQASVDQIGLVDLTYQLKVNQMGAGFYGNSLNGYLIDFLRLDVAQQANGSTETYRKVFNVLETEIQMREIEYALLLNGTGQIVASGNMERQAAFFESSVGDVFNPNGLTDRMLAKKDHVGYQIKSSVIVPRAQVRNQRPPEWRERPHAYLPSGDYSWVDQPEHDCLVRFTLTNVHGDESDPRSFLGVVVSGDVLNGKIPVAYKVVDSLAEQGGFVGVFVRNPVDNEFVKSSLYYRSFHSDGDEHNDFVLDSADVNPAPQSLLRRAVSKGRGDAVTTHNDNFVLAAMPVPPGTVQESKMSDPVIVSEDIPDAVIVRGIDMGVHTTFTDVLHLTLIAMGVVLFIEILTLFLSIRYLITPLENMAAVLRRGMRLEEADFGKLHVGRLTAVCLLLSALPALGCIIFVALANIKAIDSAMLERAEGQVGAGAIAFQLKVDQMSLSAFSDANREAIHGALLNRTDPDAVAAATAVLQSEISGGRIEFAMLCDMNRVVVASPNANRVGEIFDPVGLVAATSRYHVRLKWTAPLSYEELVKEDAPQWQERLDPSTPPSALHPFDTQESTVARYTTTLVDADADGLFDGVLISGDIVSGKTSMVEAMLAVNDVGYEAVYFKQGDRWILCASVKRYDLSEAIEVDVPFPYEDILDYALEEDHAESQFGTIQGKDYVFAATAVDSSIAVLSSGDQLAVDSEPIVVMVHGNPTTEEDAIKKEQITVLIVILVLQILTSIVGVWIAFEPVRKTLTVLERYGFARKTSSWRGCFGGLETTTSSPRTSEASGSTVASVARRAPLDTARSQDSSHSRRPSETLSKLMDRLSESETLSKDAESQHTGAELADPEASFESVYRGSGVLGSVHASGSPTRISSSSLSSSVRETRG